MKALHVTFAVLLFLLLFLAAALTAVWLFVDPQVYKDRLVAWAAQQSGYAVKVEGPVRLRVFPWIALELNGVRVDSPAGFQAPLAELDRLSVAVAFWPLFKQQVHAGDVRIEGLRVALERRADGAVNWLPAAHTAQEGAAAPATPAAAGLDWALGDLRLGDVAVTWRDPAGVWRIEGLDAELQALRPGRPAPFSLRFAVRGEKPKLLAGFKAQGRVRLDPAAPAAELSDLQWRLEVGGEPVPGRNQRVAGRWQRLAWSGAERRVELAGVETAVAGLTLVLDGAGGWEEGRPFEGRLRLAGDSLRDTLARLGIESPTTRDPAVLGRLAVDGEIHYRPPALDLETLRIALDDTQIEGRLGLPALAEPRLSFELAIDALDADRYLPPPVEGSGDAPAGAEPPADPEIVWPAEALAGVAVDGRLRIGRLSVANLQLEAIDVAMALADAALRVAPLSLRLYEGRLQGSLAVAPAGEAALWRAQLQLDDLAVGALLRDLLDDDSPFLSGRGALELELESQGRRLSELESALGGRLDLRLRDGAIGGVNLAARLREARARLRGEPLPPEAAEKRTDFTALRLAGPIENGVLHIAALEGASPLLRLAGGGRIDIPARGLDLELQARLVATSTGQDGETDAAGVEFPVRIRGPWSGPKVEVDWRRLLGEQRRAEAEARLQAERARLERERAEAQARLEAEKKAAEARAREKLEAERKRLDQEREKKKQELLDRLFK